MNYEIADRLIELRKKRGFSQEELSDKLSISRQAVSKWERAEALPDTENLIALAKLYGVSLDELVDNKATSAKVAKTPRYLPPRVIYLAIALVSFIVSIICLSLVGYFISELIEIHQPGYVFEPGDTLQSERTGYIISLVISSIFAILGLVSGVFTVIKYRKSRNCK
ncbi:MAG: helix-turn-helix transcriptional regulator [Firmicutes bacterium]|nr:helix-turn-helix transcriptional regulator [Bacillota bacterium]